MPDTQSVHFGRKITWHSGDEVTMPSLHDRYKIDEAQAGWYSRRRGGLRQRFGDVMSASRGPVTTLAIGVHADIPLRSDSPGGLSLQTTGPMVVRDDSGRVRKVKLFASGTEATNDPAATWTERMIVSAELPGTVPDSFSAAASQKALAKVASKRGYVYLVSLPTHHTEAKPAAETSTLPEHWKSFLDDMIRTRLVTDEAVRSPQSLGFVARLHGTDVAVDQRRALFNDLYRSFETEPFENGIGHPAEHIIEDALDDASTLDWIPEFCTDESDPGFAASVLRCLGRVPDAGHGSWRNELIRTALESSDIEIRDAAVQAAESWGGEGIIGILKAHQEPESWIREYIEDVINDLGA